jgi:two-component system invasion response regulator UvrY
MQNREIRSPLELLSLREKEVLQLTVEGHSSFAIAEKLGLSPKTVETYRSRLMGKIGVHDLPELVRFAIKHGITSVD